LARESFESFTGSFGGVVTFEWAPNPIIVAKQLEVAADALNNMALPLMAARDLSIADVRENFEGEHDPDGGAWQPWSISYIESGQTGAGILKKTFDLMDSATSPSAWPITAREVFFSFGALPEYGIYHQTGAVRQSAGRGRTRKANVAAERDMIASGFSLGEGFGINTLPARPFAGISVETQIKIVDIFDAWFGGIIGLAMNPSSSRGTIQTKIGGKFGPSVVDFTPSP